MATPPQSADKTTWVLALLGILMAVHLSFLGFVHPDKPAEKFQQAAETYITVILALMAPIPGRK